MQCAYMKKCLHQPKIANLSAKPKPVNNPNRTRNLETLRWGWAKLRREHKNKPPSRHSKRISDKTLHDQVITWKEMKGTGTKVILQQTQCLLQHPKPPQTGTDSSTRMNWTPAQQMRKNQETWHYLPVEAFCLGSEWDCQTNPVSKISRGIKSTSAKTSTQWHYFGRSTIQGRTNSCTHVPSNLNHIFPWHCIQNDKHGKKTMIHPLTIKLCGGGQTAATNPKCSHKLGTKSPYAAGSQPFLLSLWVTQTYRK